MAKMVPAKTQQPAVPAEPYTPTSQEVAAAEAHRKRRHARIRAPRLKVGDLKDGTVLVEPDHPDQEVWRVALEQVFGTVSPQCADMLMSAALGMVWPDPAKPDQRAFNGMLATLHGINPRDEVEAMLASQMVATHLAAMDCVKLAQLRGQTFEGRDMNLRHAAKLARTYTMQVESLKRYRSKGEQRVVVQHVNVTAEQAAIQVTGGANPAPGGRGAAPKPEEQPHAPEAARSVAFEPGAPLQCPDPAGDAVPVAGGDGAEAVPDARRH
jgi:hypothetical protein